ncbi:MAG TPA: ABC transporter ATP-binding protein, partial [Polyangiaceae bacterium]|nr:ABC transporter ATP-binding protein [Polyangiaceae bacterium]
MGTLWRITRLNLRHPWQITICIISTFIAATLQLLIPRLLGHAVDQAQGIAGGSATAAQQGLWDTAMLLLMISIARGIFTLLQNYYSESVGHHAAYELRLAAYEKLQQLSFSFHDRMHSGDLITLGILDIDGVRMFFATATVRFILLAVLIGVGAYLLISTDWLLGLLSLSFVPYVAWSSSRAHLKLRATWMDLQERLTVMSRVMEENLGGIRVVRAFAAQDHEMQKFEKSSMHALELAHERVDLRVKSTAAMNLSFFIAMGLVLWVGGYKVMDGEISVGTLAQFLTFMTILQMPVRQLGLLVNAIARGATCGMRLFGLLDLELAVKDRPAAPELKVGEGTLKFDHVSFRYPGTTRDVLKDISFEARRGETIALVGPPGSGKSSLVHLIPRYYDVSAGSISIDGQNVAEVTLDSLRRHVAVVQQDSFLFTTTIENNIAYGNPWARERRIERAAESAQLHNYVAGLPGGYGTIVGERGVSLSGGQRQRLTIARSLVLKPAVLVFDDSTAAIDAATEQRIRLAMRKFAEGRVTIVIAHRLSSLMHADQILFIEDGRIVERGSHLELLARGGKYKSL